MDGHCPPDSSSGSPNSLENRDWSSVDDDGSAGPLRFESRWERRIDPNHVDARLELMVFYLKGMTRYTRPA